MREKPPNIIMNEMSEDENLLEQIDAKDEELYNFVEQKSEGLEPNAKELIKIFTDIYKLARSEYHLGNTLEKKLLINKSKNFLDTLAETHKRIRPYLEGIQKFEKYEDQFYNFSKQAEALVQEVKDLDEKALDVKDKKIELNGRMVSIFYQLRKITEDMYTESLLNKDDLHYTQLPSEIAKKITLLDRKERKSV